MGGREHIDPFVAIYIYQSEITYTCIGSASKPRNQAFLLFGASIVTFSFFADDVIRIDVIVTKRDGRGKIDFDDLAQKREFFP
jgi:hypothetical protein